MNRRQGALAVVLALLLAGCVLPTEVRYLDGPPQAKHVVPLGVDGGAAVLRIEGATNASVYFTFKGEEPAAWAPLQLLFLPDDDAPEYWPILGMERRQPGDDALGFGGFRFTDSRALTLVIASAPRPVPGNLTVMTMGAGTIERIATGATPLATHLDVLYADAQLPAGRAWRADGLARGVDAQGHDALVVIKFASSVHAEGQLTVTDEDATRPLALPQWPAAAERHVLVTRGATTFTLDGAGADLRGFAFVALLPKGHLPEALHLVSRESEQSCCTA